MATLSNELRVNPRLRMGTALIVAICAAYALLEWRDQLDASKAEYRRVLGQLARVSSQQDQEQWRTRATEAAQARDAATARLWQNSSVGLAQAQVQDWLQTLLRQTAAKNFNLKVAEAEAALDATAAAQQAPAAMQQQDLKLLRARVDFAAEPPVLLALLAALNDAHHRVVVESLNVKSGKAELGLSFWFRIQPADAAPTTRDGQSKPQQRAAETAR